MPPGHTNFGKAAERWGRMRRNVDPFRAGDCVLTVRLTSKAGAPFNKRIMRIVTIDEAPSPDDGELRLGVQLLYNPDELPAVRIKESCVMRLSAVGRDDVKWYDFLLENCAEPNDVTEYRLLRGKLCDDQGRVAEELAPDEFGVVRFVVDGHPERFQTAVPEELDTDKWEDHLSEISEWFHQTIDGKDDLAGCVYFEYPRRRITVRLQVHSSVIYTPQWTADYIVEMDAWKRRVKGKMAPLMRQAHTTAMQRACEHSIRVGTRADRGAQREEAEEAEEAPAAAPRKPEGRKPLISTPPSVLKAWEEQVDEWKEAPAARKPEKRFKRPPKAQTVDSDDAPEAEPKPVPPDMVPCRPVSVPEIALALQSPGTEDDPLLEMPMPDGTPVRLRLSQVVSNSHKHIHWALPECPSKGELDLVGVSSALQEKIFAFFKASPTNTPLSDALGKALLHEISTLSLKTAKKASRKDALDSAPAPAPAPAPRSKKKASKAEKRALVASANNFARQAATEVAVASATDAVVASEIDKALSYTAAEANVRPEERKAVLVKMATQLATDKQEWERRSAAAKALLAKDPVASDPATASPYADLMPPYVPPPPSDVARTVASKGGQYEGLSERGKRCAAWAEKEEVREHQTLQRAAAAAAHAITASCSAPHAAGAAALEPGAADASAVLQAMLGLPSPSPSPSPQPTGETEACGNPALEALIQEQRRALCDRIEAVAHVGYRCRVCNKVRRQGQVCCGTFPGTEPEDEQRRVLLTDGELNAGSGFGSSSSLSPPSDDDGIEVEEAELTPSQLIKTFGGIAQANSLAAALVNVSQAMQSVSLCGNRERNRDN
jgi:hypothetical protein